MKLHIDQINFVSRVVTYRITTDEGKLRVGPATTTFAENATVADIKQSAVAAARRLGVAERARLNTVYQSLQDLASIETAPLN